MKFKKLMACALALGVFATTGAAIAQTQKYRVAYLARAQSDSFAAWLANSMVKEAKKYPDITLTVFDGQSQNSVMQSNIENAVTNKYDLVIIQPYDPAVQIGPVKNAMKSGMKFVATNPKFGDDSVPSVDSSPYLLGQVNAQLALKQVPQNAKVVVLLGPPGNPHSTGRRDAWQKEFFAKRPDVKIVAEQTANWNKDEAMQLTEDWIQANPKIDAVISMNDNMAAGAVEALKGSGMNPFPLVYGTDGTAEACLLIKSGKMTSTALQSADELAEKSMKMAHDILTKQKTDLHQVEGTELYTKANVDTCLTLHKKLGDIKG
ncbi:sugar ABC transporter substrate-binding protein [Burkholderia sp. Ac-20365]|uniref:sugar ABC transporter substrate-binding protein n=1 Tax=Burkholderia sp. Ac-20365 TaxID=2703897 RepID=UPI00197BEA05|nr:sugar ABC transporter substrate-binding protein [Burkholderia sp. Ac-20365]MBN3765256.1 sugar ABC transporter substrate-binding protein [Burkholderia sp. Ac-20365]